jgi:hypothetical protein
LYRGQGKKLIAFRDKIIEQKLHIMARCNLLPVAGTEVVYMCQVIAQKWYVLARCNILPGASTEVVYGSHILTQKLSIMANYCQALVLKLSIVVKSQPATGWHVKTREQWPVTVGSVEPRRGGSTATANSSGAHAETLM